MKRLTPAMRRKLVPFLPKLIRRFRAFASNKGAPGDCPLCVAAFGGRDVLLCTDCPVFGETARRWNWRENDYGPCLDYLPKIWTSKNGGTKVLAYLLRLQKQVEEGRLT